MGKKILKAVTLSLALCLIFGAIAVPTYAAKKKKDRSEITIGIDPGHQSRADTSLEADAPGSRTKKYKVTGGTSGRYSHVPEYKVTLAVGKKLRKELESRGYKVVMTRTKNNVNISNSQRAKKLNKKCDVAIRLHCDGSVNSAAHGVSMQCSSRRNRYIGKLYSSCNRLSKTILSAYCRKTGLKKNGIAYRDDLTGTNYSTIPVTLIEMGFMSNRSDDTYMAKSSNQKKMADGIADGIDDYFGF